jgi:ABC-type dipeptide/oligopeptide/nickel transport system permease component
VFAIPGMGRLLSARFRPMISPWSRHYAVIAVTIVIVNLLVDIS